MATRPETGSEARRLASLRAMQVLDTPHEPRYDRLTRLARRALDVPIAAIVLVDAARVWVKSGAGLRLRQWPRAGSFCDEVVATADAAMVADARRDPRFARHPLVEGEPWIGCYAGCPIAAPDGQPVGVFVAMGHRARVFGQDDMALLQDFAAMAAETFAAGPTGPFAITWWPSAEDVRPRT